MITVLVPTHSHGPLLAPAVRSALAQTVRDLEVLIVGDGPTAATDACARGLAADPRVRYLPFEKGERHGERHRHRVLTEEAREHVLYLSDDDLWMPGHAEHVLGLLRDADFAHALSAGTRPDGTTEAAVVDLALPYFRRRLIEGDGTPSITVVGHTMEAYRRLPHGWRTTPEGIHTDQWMWRQWLEQDWVRAASGAIPTAVQLPSPLRSGWTDAARLEELERYERAIADPEWRLRHAEGVLEQVFRGHAWLREHAEGLARSREDIWGQLESVRGSRAWRLSERLRGLR